MSGLVSILIGTINSLDREELLDQENRAAAERLAAKVASLKSVS